MSRSLKYLAGLFVILAVGVSTAHAGDYDHARNGFMIGFGVGAGSLGFEDGDERETSGIGNFRIGYAVRPDLVLHLESNAWVKTYKDALLGAGDVTVTASSAVLAVTFYPPGSGAFLRAGLGGGQVNLEVETAGVTISDDDTGFAALAAAGYEWRLTQKFALAPQGEFTYQSLDLLGTSTMFDGSLGFNWYW